MTWNGDTWNEPSKEETVANGSGQTTRVLSLTLETS
eukprot:CAMPEP_0205937184 /NCGR_PEP_ID=MMETSP1325-20131115/43452_1 /ASSEMBLY_ACC=CAM_ASM_000708 /TAXON_ID=236786 /ORGANISM="Florenciella sp., Strain RCC1007" /LENGTH=35 /DNA_ID= /DNA_START= /DNA_END= /DNA_ORIENTATION=